MYMPAMAIITVKPEISTARPEVAAAASSAACSSAPGRALLALAAQVEQRVVHAHGQADQQDHRGDRLVHRHDLADRADQADGGRHGRDRQQQRHARRDQRAEGEHQDHERDRQRGELRLLEVVLELLASGPCPRWRRRTARSAARGGPSGPRRWRPSVASTRSVGLVVVLGRDLEAHERRARRPWRSAPSAAYGPSTSLDVLGAAEPLARRPPRRRGTPGRLRLERAVARLDEHRLRRLVCGKESSTSRSASPESPDARAVVVERVGAHGAAADHGQHHEHQPSDDRLAAVLGAPAPCSRCEVLVHGSMRTPGWRPARAAQMRPARRARGAVIRSQQCGHQAQRRVGLLGPVGRVGRPPGVARRARRPSPPAAPGASVAMPTNRTRPDGIRISALGREPLGHHRPLLLELARRACRPGARRPRPSRRRPAPSGRPRWPPTRRGARPASGPRRRAPRRARRCCRARRRRGAATSGPAGSSRSSAARRRRSAPASRAASPSWVGEPRSASSAIAASAAAWPRRSRLVGRRRSQRHAIASGAQGPRASTPGSRVTPTASTVGSSRMRISRAGTPPTTALAGTSRGDHRVGPDHRVVAHRHAAQDAGAVADPDVVAHAHVALVDALERGSGAPPRPSRGRSRSASRGRRSRTRARSTRAGRPRSCTPGPSRSWRRSRSAPSWQRSLQPWPIHDQRPSSIRPRGAICITTSGAMNDEPVGAQPAPVAGEEAAPEQRQRSAART